jgi:hypothetical protein
MHTRNTQQGPKAVENRVAHARAKLATMLDAGQVQDVSEVRRESGV